MININMDFVTGGKAIFTASNDKSEHYTFKVVKGKPSPQASMVTPPLFVHILTGPHNYTYLGMLVGTQIRLTHKSKMKQDSKPVQVFNWALRVVNGEKHLLRPGYDIQHEGRCGKCGRELTDPESIRTGFGPTCRNASYGR